jgi:hypothetical protein
MTRLTRRGWIVVGALLTMAAMAVFGQWAPDPASRARR